MISVVGRGLLVKFQIGDTLVVLDGAGHQGQMVLDGRRCNEDIKITNHLTLPSQASPDAGELLHDGLG